METFGIEKLVEKIIRSESIEGKNVRIENIVGKSN